MSIIRRAFAVGFCASIFLLGGCTTNVQQPADLSARSHDPRGLISGLPAAGEAVCLTAASDHSPTIDIAVRQALRDRGYKAVMLSAQESPRPKQCRFLVAVSGRGAMLPGDPPSMAALDYRDLYTGETQRAVWKLDRAATAWRRASADSNGVPYRTDVQNLLVTPAVGDFELILRDLVDQLFPAVR